MQIFFILLIKILPLYAIIAVAFILGKCFKINREYITKPIVYLIMPVVVFSGLIDMKLSFGNLLLPVAFFTIGTTLSFLVLWTAKQHWRDGTENILGFMAGSGNTSYFGIPVAVALFGREVLGLAVMITLGIILFEQSVGVYHVSRGHFSVKASLIKLIKLPTIWAFVVGIMVSISGIKFGSTYFEFADIFKDLYVTLGMSVIGFSLAAIRTYKLDLKYLSLAYFVKFIIWPLIVSALIYFDKSFFHIFPSGSYEVMLLMSITPIAANTVIFASELKVEPEKAAMAVFSSTVIALFYIPLVVSLFLDP